MTPGVCTWCGCALPDTCALSTRCRSCRRWLLADPERSAADGPFVYLAVPLRIDATDRSVAFRPRWARWRMLLWHGLIVAWLLVPPRVSEWFGAPYFAVGALALYLVIAGWLFDRPRVTIDADSVRVRGGWRRSRTILAGEIGSVSAAGDPGPLAGVIVARLRDRGEAVQVVYLPDPEASRVLAAHIRHVLGLPAAAPAGVAVTAP